MHGEHRIRAEQGAALRGGDQGAAGDPRPRGPRRRPGRRPGRQRRPRADDRSSSPRSALAPAARAVRGRALARRRTPTVGGDPGRAILIEAKRPRAGHRDGRRRRASWIGVRTRRYAYVEHYELRTATPRGGLRRRRSARASWSTASSTTSSCDPLPAREPPRGPAVTRRRERRSRRRWLGCGPAAAPGCLLDVAVPASWRGADGSSRRPARPIQGLMFDIDAALRTLVEQEGSDLHVKVPAPPMTRVHGELAPIPGAEPLEARGHRARAAPDPHRPAPAGGVRA